MYNKHQNRELKGVEEFDDYRDFLRTRLEDLKAQDPSFTYSSIADGAKVQRSYLTNVLRKRADLNADQLFLIAKALRLSRDEIQFLNLALESARCQVPERRNLLVSQQKSIRKQLDKSSRHLQEDVIVAPTIHQTEFYSDIWPSVILLYLENQEFCRNPHRLSDHLDLDAASVDRYLKLLSACGFIALDGSRVRRITQRVHLDDSVKAARLHATLFRLKAIEQQQRPSDERNYFYTGTYATSPKLRAEIKRRFLTFLGWLDGELDKSSSEEVFQMNFDLFDFIRR